jgi:hypothetical protein
MKNLKWLVASGVVALLLIGAIRLGLRPPQLRGGAALAVFFLLSRILFEAARSRKGDIPSVRNAWQAPRRRDQGVWADPPVAELDKSTFGRLLADRLRRNPGLRVVVAPRQSPPLPPASTDGLWDRELDG